MDWKGITHDYNLRPRTSRERPIVQSRAIDEASSSQNQEMPEQQNRNMDDELMIVPDRELLARITSEVLRETTTSSSDDSEDESNGPRPRYKRYKCKRCQKKRAKYLRKPRSGLRSSTAKKASAESSLDDLKCVICLDTVKDRRMKYIRCGHGFHRKCCNNWLKISSNCPVCRAVVGNYLRIPGTNPSRPDLYETTPISDIIFFFTLSVMSR